MVKKDKSVVGKISQEGDALCQGCQMEEDGVKLDNFGLGSCVLKSAEMFKDIKLWFCVLEMMPVCPEHTVTLLEAQ